MLALVGVLAVAAGPVHAVCSTTWVGGVDSHFGTASNWSTGTVPTGSDDVCITATTTTSPHTATDTYTVILNGNFTVHSLTLGGPNGTQTLVLPAANLRFDLGGDSVITATGVLTLGDGGDGYSWLANTGGALTNSGHLNTIAGGGGTRYLRLNISNTAGGTIDIAAPTNQDQGALTTNHGTVTIAAAGVLALSNNSSFANIGGTITNNGVFSVSAGTFVQRGGIGVGNAVILAGSTLDDDTAAGTAAFVLAAGTNTLTGSGSNPGVAAGQTVTLAANNAFANLAKDLTNAGTITLGDTGGGYSVLRGPGLLTNTGHLNTIVGGGGIRYLRLNITNGAGGTVHIAAPDTRQDSVDVGPTTFTNNGTITIDAVAGLALSGGASFVNNGGAVTNNGAFRVSGGTFTQRSGSQSGNPVLLSGSTLDDDLGAGAGLFSFTGNGALTGTGSNPGVAVGQVVTVSAANTFVALGVNLTNAGTITLGDAGGGYSVLRGPGLLNNTGHLNTIVGGGGIRFLRLNITNGPGGTVDIAAPDTRQDGLDVGPTTFTNNGTVTIDAVASLGLSGGTSFVNNGGAVTNNGAFRVSNGTFTQRGGSQAGNPVLLSGSTLDDDLGAGAGFFTFTGNGTLTGSGSNPGVAVGQVVTVSASNISVALGVNLTNAGTIILGDSGGGYSWLANPGTLTNSGQLNTIAGGGGIRYLRLNITNTAAGTITIGTATNQDQGGNLTTNNGTVTVEPAGTLALSGFSFANNGGTVSNNGTFGVSSGTFTQRGGTVTGTAVLLSGSTLDDDLGAGAALFTFTGNGTLTGSGSNPGVAAGQVVTVSAANISVALGVDLTNAGTITLGDSGGGYSWLANPGALTNSGGLNTIVGGGGGRFLRLNITNTATGTIVIRTTTTQDQGTLTRNNGTVMIEAGGRLSLSSGSSFAQGASATFAPTIDANATTFGQLTAGGGPVSLAGKLLVQTVGSPAINSTWPIIANVNRSGQFASLDYGANNYDVQYTSTGATLVALATPTPTSTPTPTLLPRRLRHAQRPPRPLARRRRHRLPHRPSRSPSRRPRHRRGQSRTRPRRPPPPPRPTARHRHRLVRSRRRRRRHRREPRLRRQPGRPPQARPAHGPPHRRRPRHRRRPERRRQRRRPHLCRPRPQRARQCSASAAAMATPR